MTFATWIKRNQKTLLDLFVEYRREAGDKEMTFEQFTLYVWSQTKYARGGK
jgi:hypothetical protein